ncbi:hypothetical protein Pan216_47910 [Planctomycetes bacterium Pan216]|uniref:Limiting CO2-inducible protein B/C beta carbonyic anhydrase domain-containing protein n=1 Tax=Kolteria novifilia TaxID=2527975 RepID=A0A518BA93_9BACT|nr:hypothetical protein Pan216_47910 [Planctomycetes bacterium Pan216]
MGWQEVLQSNYPGAKRNSEVGRTYAKLFADKVNAEPETTIFAKCCCADEVNGFWPIFTGLFIGPFQLGGLAGFPFTGQTGVGAFAHHVPENGTAVILYGPHVGISDIEGEKGGIGHVRRIGQPAISSCCGALVAALDYLKNGTSAEAAVDDYQQTTLKESLLPFKSEILQGHPAQQKKAITDVMYRLIRERIRKLVACMGQEFHGHAIVTLGGIFINTHHASEDYFEPRDAEQFIVESTPEKGRWESLLEYDLA